MTCAPVRHCTIDLDGFRIFYREAGPKDAPVVLLPHGYPSSSFQYRNLMPLLADRWRLVAPDYPGFGYSDTPADFAYDFDGYTSFLESFNAALGLKRYAIYLHDYGSQIGLRLAIRQMPVVGWSCSLPKCLSGRRSDRAKKLWRTLAGRALG